MKINYALILAASLSTGLVVQPVFSDEQPAPAVPAPTPAPPATSDSNKVEAPAAPLMPIPDASAKKAPATAKKSAAPAAKKAKAKEVKAKAAEPITPAAPLAPGPATARQDNVNVRGQAAINSEVVTRLKKGQQVTVLEEITKKAKPDEVSKWAKVNLPSGTVVWVHGSFIDAATKTVKPKKLNLRSGPGENYSVVGLLEKSAPIKEIETKGDWIKIEAPASAYGFVAAHLLLNAPAEPVIASVEPPKTPAVPPAPPATPPEVAVVTPAPAPPVGTAPLGVAPVTPPPVEVATAPVPIPATPPAKPEEEEKEEPLVKRVISREGIVKRSVSIQAPAYFVLQSLDNGKTINYLHATTTNMVLKDFWNQRVVVTGEEQLDERWPNTPVIYVDSLQPVQ